MLLDDKKNINESPIAVFDSGVGGLTVLKKLLSYLPDEQFLYFADTDYVPYGSKDEMTINSRCIKIVNWLERMNAKAVIIACNTATTCAIEQLRQRSSLPIFGVEPAIKPASIQSNTKTIAVLATKGTLKSKKYLKLLKNHAQDVQVIAVDCSDWVLAIERGLLSGAEVDQLIKNSLQHLPQSTDTVILGCTHFLWYRKHINEYFKQHVEIIEAAAPLAAWVKKKLAHDCLLNKKKSEHQSTLVIQSTAPSEILQILSKHSFPQLKLLEEQVDL